MPSNAQCQVIWLPPQQHEGAVDLHKEGPSVSAEYANIQIPVQVCLIDVPYLCAAPAAARQKLPHQHRIALHRPQASSEGYVDWVHSMTPGKHEQRMNLFIRAQGKLELKEHSRNSSEVLRPWEPAETAQTCPKK